MEEVEGSIVAFVVFEDGGLVVALAEVEWVMLLVEADFDNVFIRFAGGGPLVPVDDWNRE